MDIEGISLDVLKALPADEQDALLVLGRPLAFRMGSATVLAEFNRTSDDLVVNLAHIDGGGEGVLLALWKALARYAADRDYVCVQWNVHALTCAKPNPRLQRFLRAQGFTEADHPAWGRILTRRQALRET